MFSEEILTEMYELAVLILSPLLLVLIGILFALGVKSFKLDADKGLLHQGLLWIAILLPIVYFFAFGSIAWDGYVVKVSSEGLVTFFSISQIPLAFLSLALPLKVLVARFNSTEQTARQIKITTHKNNLDSFYAHRKEMFSYFEPLDETDYFGVINAKFKVHPRLHKNLFLGRPDLGVPEVNNEMFEHKEQTLSSARYERLRSPYTLSTRLTVGQYFEFFVAFYGKQPSSRE